MIDASLDEGQTAGQVLDIPMFRRIYERYPAAYRKDAKFFVGGADSNPGGSEADEE